jgi:hypothetical protein
MPPFERSPVAGRALAAVLGAFALLALLYPGTFSQFANPNELSRYQAVTAAADRGTFEISKEIGALGGHEDIAVADGRIYSNKAPGLAFAAIPVYRVLRLVLPAPSTVASPIFQAVRFLTVSVASILALAAFGRRLSGANARSAPLLVYAVAFGTPFLFYARSFFAHAWTAALLFLAWDRILAAEESAASRRVSVPYLVSGFLAGLAAISEYPVALISLLLAIRAASRKNGWAFALFLAGLAVPLSGLAVYDTVCFGAPWVLSSAREGFPEYQKLATGGGFGFQAPSLKIALAYLFHPARGVLVFSPFLLWCVPGFLRWWRLQERRADFALCLASTVLFFIAMTAYPNWHGGWSLGSRYLLPVLFFAAFPIARALDSPLSRGLFLAAVVFSAGTHLLLTSTFAHFPDSVPVPAATGSWWFLTHGWISPSVFGSSAAAGAAALVLAALAFAAPLALSARTAAPLSPRPALCVLLGAAPLAVLLLRPPPLSYPGRLWRAGVFGQYSGRDPERRELAAVARAAATPEEQRQAIRAWRVFGPRTP